jgi:hypothetical protein
VSAALLSFEGTTSRLDSRFEQLRSMPRRHDLLIVENCIEKNFHVSNMRAVRAHFRVRADAISKKKTVIKSRRSKVDEHVRKSTKERTGEYLGITGDEGRSKLR